MVPHHVLAERDREGADAPHRFVQGAEVVVVAGEVVCTGFPVGIDDETLWRAKHFDTVLVQTEDEVEVPGHAPEVSPQRWGSRVEGREDQAVEGLHLGCLARPLFSFVMPPSAFFHRGAPTRDPSDEYVQP